MKTPTSATIVLCLFTFLSSLAHAYEPSWDGNHPDSASEAWTWMGHLQELETSNTGTRLGSNGLGFIYYYTRNNTGDMGRMNFRSSSLTSTFNGEGKKQWTDTLYSAQFDDAEFRARKGKLDLSFKAGSRVSDRVRAVSMTDADLRVLAQIMKLYPGLQIAEGFTPKKSRFEVTERNGIKIALDLYSIWPAVSPENGKIAFLGQAETFTFSEPMVVAVGTYAGKKVAGLTFVDRQWSKEYFGTYAMDGLNDLMKYANAMKFSHTWSAFHAFNVRTKEWTFFHLWNQFKRTADRRDQKVDYSGMIWTTNGRPAQATSREDYTWTGSGFILNQGRQVLLNYAMDRYGFFPSRAHIKAPKLGLELKMYATPALQNLNQPIPFYEAYASGEGSWNGDRIRVQGRLESSRLMFRTQDYEEMVDVLKTETEERWRQPELRAWLENAVAEDRDVGPFDWIGQKLSVMAGMMSDLDLKLAVFGAILSGDEEAVDPRDRDVMIYR